MKRLRVYSGSFDLGPFTDAYVLVGEWHREQGDEPFGDPLYEWLRAASDLTGQIWRWQIKGQQGKRRRILLEA